MLHRRRPARQRTRTLLGIGLTVAVLTGLTGLWATANAAGAAYLVSPTGADTNPGTAAAAPFRTLQKALDLAARRARRSTSPPATYREAVATKTAGTAAAPITDQGSGDRQGRQRPLQGGARTGSAGACSASTTATTRSSGFTIDGQQNIARTEYPAVSSLSQIRAFKDSVQGRARSTASWSTSAPTHHAVRHRRHDDLEHVPQRLRRGVRAVPQPRREQPRSYNSMIQWCGMLGQGDDTDQYKYHNAEGVYIGTSPKSTDQPLYANDTSNNIVVRDSTINTYGSECFEVKENAHHNRMENSKCGWNDEPLDVPGQQRRAAR